MSKSSLNQAMALQHAAAQFGFDWPEEAMVWEKLSEELKELELAKTVDEKASEMGDVLFTVVNLARLLNIDPEAALEAANIRFKRRFAYVCQSAETLPPKGDPARLDAMEARWQEAKRIEKASNRSDQTARPDGREPLC